LHCKCTAPTSSDLTAGDKWNAVDPSSQIFYANPEECQKFLGNGEMTVTEFIRAHNTLAHNGFINWNNSEFHETLRGTVGQKFFHHMANLDMDYLEALATPPAKQKVKYLDYGTECKLRRMLDKEAGGDRNGGWARDHLRRHREFYGKWEKALFGDHVFQVPALPPTVQHEAESRTEAKVKGLGVSLRCNIYAIISGIIIYVAAFY
jgi:hypothetical protein